MNDAYLSKSNYLNMAKIYHHDINTYAVFIMPFILRFVSFQQKQYAS